MTTVSDLFPSDTSREALLAVQRLVAEMAITKDDFGKPHIIAGVDQAFVDDAIISGIVVLDYNSLEVIERAYSIQPVSFPYIPTFLTFRERPAIVNTYKKLKVTPDILAHEYVNGLKKNV